MRKPKSFRGICFAKMGTDNVSVTIATHDEITIESFTVSLDENATVVGSFIVIRYRNEF